MEKIINMKICGYDVKIKKFKSWYCGYVQLDGELNDCYLYESYRNNNIIGVDTNHSWNLHHSQKEKYENCIEQLYNTIREHQDKNLNLKLTEKEIIAEREEGQKAIDWVLENSKKKK
ncbi:MAG: hypothetical protein KC589_09875 [Nanoarchaeota archaeon]|nr:hypothetical protein [Nanoarchaeota archaeon]